MSGGRATVARARGEDVRQSGDVTAVAPEGHKLTDFFYIECKHYKDLSVGSIFLGKGLLAKYWRTTCKEAAHYGRQPLLIAKQNNFPTLVLMPNLLPTKKLGFRGQGVVTCFYRRNLPHCRVLSFDELIKTKFKDVI